MSILVVLVLMGTLFLSACGDDAKPLAEETTGGPAIEETTDEEEAVAEETAVDASELSLTIWADDTRTPALESVAPAFEEEFGVTIVIKETSLGDIRNQFTIAAAGEGPDIVVGAHDWLDELVSDGRLASIDLGDKRSDFAEASVRAFTYGGQLYGVPNAIENVAFFINTDLVSECPATYDEVRALSEELAAGNDDNIATNQYGFVRMEGDPFHFFPIQTAFGGYVFGVNEDGDYNPDDVGIDSEGAIAAAQWLNSMVEEGLQPPAVDWESMHIWFENGQSAMTITGPWALPRFRESGVNYAICDIPDQTEDGRPFLSAWGFMVSASSEAPLLAQTFLTEFVATEEVMSAMYSADPRAPAYLPALNSLEDEDLVAFGEAGLNALPIPPIPEMDFVWEAWGSAIMLIHQQANDPESAFTNAAEQIRMTIVESQ